MLWAVLDRRGECYAIEESLREAQAKLRDADRFLQGAVDSGHPRARAWVNERTPLVLMRITPQRAEELRDEAVPVLDREG